MSDTHTHTHTHTLSQCLPSNSTNEVIQDEFYLGPWEPINQECVVLTPCMRTCVCECVWVSVSVMQRHSHARKEYYGRISLNISSCCLTVWEFVLLTFPMLAVGALLWPWHPNTHTHTHTHTRAHYKLHCQQHWHWLWFLHVVWPQSSFPALNLPPFSYFNHFSVWIHPKHHLL